MKREKMTMFPYGRTTFDYVPESPALEEGFIGIKINAQKSVIRSSQMKIPIHGSYRFTASFCNRFDSLTYEMALVCIDVKTQTPYIKNMQNSGFSSKKRKYDESDPDLDETTEESWFNSDLSFFVHQPFPKNVIYNVFAIIGEYKSNVLTIEIQEI